MRHKVCAMALVMIGGLLAVNSPARANAWDDWRSLRIDQQKTVERIAGPLVIRRTTSASRTSTSETVRGRDLRTSVGTTLAKARDAVKNARLRLNLLTGSRAKTPNMAAINAADIMKRNKVQQQMDKVRREDLARAAKERTRDFNQRIKDRR